MADIHYPPDFVTGLQMQWGKGFLSPGGPEEVAEILRTVDVAGKSVLDIGCGVGGPAMVIAEQLGASDVVGIDIEEYLIETAQENVSAAGLGDRVSIKLVEEGPLPFADGRFDIVFSKDSLIHVPNKSALYREVLRVLTPGGVFAASDWLRGEDAENLDGYKEWRSLSSLDFRMQTPAETETEMRNAGLTGIRTNNRSEWYADVVDQEVAMMRGDAWRDRFVSAFGEDAYEKKLAVRIANARAAACDGLQPTHLFGRKPTSS
nr:methyltransferase domain-containing protein [uncultured Ruegeria sp.]